MLAHHLPGLGLTAINSRFTTAHLSASGFTQGQVAEPALFGSPGPRGPAPHVPATMQVEELTQRGLQ